MSRVDEIYNVSDLHITPRVDGTPTGAVSYPAGALWVFVPQALTGYGQASLALTTLGLTVASFAFLIRESPPVLGVVPIVVALGARNYLWAGIGGILDILWIAPTLVAMHYWKRDRWVLAAVFAGLACGSKQQAWFYTPFLAIWIWNASPTLDVAVERARKTLAAGLAAFFALNLPFVVWDLDAWLGGALFPIFGKVPLIHQGVGPTMTTTMGVYTLPSHYYTLLFALGSVVALTVYSLYWDRLKWAAWIMPGALLLLPHRSLPSYVLFVVPVAYYAVLCHFDLAVGPALANDDVDDDTAEVAA